MFCKKCGMQLPNGAMFCPGCGSAAQAQSPQGQPTQYNGQGPQYQGQPTQYNNPAPQYQGQPSQYNNPAPRYQGQAPVQPGGFAGNIPPVGRTAGRAAAGAANAAARAAGKKKRMILLAVIAFLLLVIAALLYFLFLKPNKPEDTVYKMAEALENLDQDAYLECFDSQSGDLYNGLLGVGGELTGIDLGAYADLANGMGGILAAAGMSPQVDVTIDSIEYLDKKTCIVRTTFHVKMEMMEMDESVALPLYMDLTGRDWLINGAQTALLMQESGQI